MNINLQKKWLFQIGWIIIIMLLGYLFIYIETRNPYEEPVYTMWTQKHGL